MSPTAIPSSGASNAGRKAWAPRWLVVTHRYLGVLIGLLMLMWFLSGIVMLFVHWPEVTPEERASGLAPIPWHRCCSFGADLPDLQLVDSASVEELAGHAVLRLPGQVLDLTTGRAMAPLSAIEAAAVAQTFASQAGHPVSPTRPELVERDQWTVTGYFNKRRPFWRVRMSDAAATDIYVSRATGEVSQVTTRAERILNWLGPIPHWLYPAILRQDVMLWTQVVIWSSLLGTFLTVTGIYLGIIAWRPRRTTQLSPYRGLMMWHHLTGLAAGLLTFTWVLSGFFSMQPWGLLESPPDARAERLRGGSTLDDVRTALVSLDKAAPPAAQVRLTPLGGEPFLTADEARFDARGQPAPLSPSRLATAVQALGSVRDQQMMRSEDPYYYGHHSPVTLPVWRVILQDGSRYYLDPGTGEILASADAAAKGYRWLHLGLHRLDFVPGFNRGWTWAAVMSLLLAGATVSIGTGVWLGWRRVSSDFGRLRRS